MSAQHADWHPNCVDCRDAGYGCAPAAKGRGSLLPARPTDATLLSDIPVSAANELHLADAIRAGLLLTDGLYVWRSPQGRHAMTPLTAAGGSGQIYLGDRVRHTLALRTGHVVELLPAGARVRFDYADIDVDQRIPYRLLRRIGA